MRKISIILIALLLSVVLPAQQESSNRSIRGIKTSPLASVKKPVTKRNCITPQMEAKLQQKYPGRASSEVFEKALQKAIDFRKSMRVSATEQVYKIPTVIHVIHNGESVGTGGNISSAQVMSQFDVLNEDFRRLGNGFNDHADGADVNVEFYPAKLNPEGQALEEPGINRVNGQRAFWEESPIEINLKPTTIWDPDRYLNIWVVTFGGDLDGVLGYAQFPSLSGLEGFSANMGPANTDGVVIGHQFFGNTGTAQSPYDLGRTATHEVGHWLGLIHIWGDGGCEVDDYCEDTPNAGGPNSGCSRKDSCPGDDLPDMIENYMDYTDDACMNIFTQDQKTRMRTVLEISPRRNSLIGPQCIDASQVNEGTVTSSSPAWFTYTADTDGIVTVSSVGQTNVNTYLSIFADCATAAINSNNNAFGTEQSELSTLVQTGEEIKIFWSALYSEEEFNWSVATSMSTDAAVCELAVAASEGTNSIPSTNLNSYWYTFLMPDDQSKISIDGGDHIYNIYRGSCSGLTNIRSGFGNTTLADFDQGEQLFIEFETNPNGGNFSWDLNILALEPGETCVTAVTATEGTNTTPTAPYWFTFTMPKSGVLNVSSTNQTTVPTYGQLYEGCSGNILLDNTANDMQSHLILDAREGDEITIFWDSTYATDGFDWELSIADYAPGESCLAAATAIEGINTVSSTPYWYTFTMPIDGNLMASSVGQTNVDTYLIMLDDCDGEILAESDDYGSDEALQSQATAYSLQAGQTVKILWLDAYSNDGFDWTLLIKESKLGDDCTNPATAVVGNNSVPAFTEDFYWSVFKVPSADKKYTVSSTSSEYVYVADNCEELNVIASGYENSIFTGLTTNTEVIIAWELTKGGNFSYSMTEEDLSPGDVCSDPITTAIVGTNNAAYAPSWYKFTMPVDGEVIISSSGFTDEDTDLFVLNDCNGDLLAANDDIDGDLDDYTSQVTIGNLSAGDDLLIYWAPTWSSEGFDWSLTLISDQPGLDCSNPETAITGTNSLPKVFSDAFWYKFTVTERDKKLVISSNADEYVYLVSDCESQSYFQEGYSGLSATGLEVNQEVYIVWTLDNQQGFDWNLELFDLEAGDACDMAIQPIVGENSAPRAPVWYEFTMPKTGDIQISSVGLTTEDTFLAVFENCDGDLLAQNDDFDDVTENYQSEVIITDVNEGTLLYILWLDDYSNMPFKWELTLLNIANSAPEMSDQSINLAFSELTNGHVIATMSATDADGDILTYSISDGNDAGAFDLNPNTGVLTLKDVNLWDRKSTSLTVEVTDQVEITRANVTITSVILSSNPRRNFVVYPNPADLEVYIKLPLNTQLKSGWITDLSGKRIEAFYEKSIDVSRLQEGIYLIFIELDNGETINQRMIIKH